MATSSEAGNAQIPEASPPDSLSKKIFLITVVGAAAFIGVALFFVIL
jgi:hypothetical protein